MLDTSTGRLWQLVLDAKTNEFVLTPVRYRMLSGAESLDAPLANSEVDDYQAKKGPKTTGNPKQSAEQFLDAAGFPVKPAPIKASTPTPKTP